MVAQKRLNIPLYVHYLSWYLLSGYYTYVSKCVGIRGYFSKPKGVHAQKEAWETALQGFIDVVVIAIECEMRLANNGWWIYRDGSESRFLPIWRVSKCLVLGQTQILVLRRTTNVGILLRGRNDDSESRRHDFSIFKTRQLRFRFLIRYRNRRLEIRLGDRMLNSGL